MYLSLSLSTAHPQVLIKTCARLRPALIHTPSAAGPSPAAAAAATTAPAAQEGKFFEELCSAVLGVFQEQEASNHGAMWEMVLAFAKVRVC